MKKTKMTREIGKWVGGFVKGTGETVTCTKTEQEEFTGYSQYRIVWVSDDGRTFTNVIKRGYYNCFVEC